MKNKIFKLIIFIFAIQLANASDLLYPIRGNSMNFNKINSLKICENNEKNCVSEHQALFDLFPKQSITVVANYGMIANKSLSHVIYSAKINDGKDLYAVFLLQTNEINENQGLSNCNACGAKLGIVVYQYHNKWKLFGAEPNLKDDGSNGKIEIVNNSFTAYSLGAEKLMLTYDTYGQAQGYENTSKSIIAINLDLWSSISTSSKSNIKYVGYITTKESSCNAKKDGEYWNGVVIFENINFSVPKVKMEKTISTCESKKVIKRESLIYDKVGSDKKFVSNLN